MDPTLQGLERAVYSCGCVRHYPPSQVPTRCETCNAPRVNEAEEIAFTKAEQTRKRT